MSGTILYGYLPYAALLLCGVGVVRRFSTGRPREARTGRGAWAPGLLPVMVGAGIVALNHLVGVLLREPMRMFLASPTRLFAFEAVSLIGGMLLAWGLLQVGVHRMLSSGASWLFRAVYALLLFQVVQGLALAIGMRWGALWALDITVPYLRSLLLLRPEVALLEQAPLMVRLHVLVGFLVMAVAPFAQSRRAGEPEVARMTPQTPVLAPQQQEVAPRVEL